MFDINPIPKNLRYGNVADSYKYPTSPVNQNNDININITTRSDNPDEIGRRVKLAMLDVFDSYNLQAGYLNPTV